MWEIQFHWIEKPEGGHPPVFLLLLLVLLVQPSAYVICNDTSQDGQKKRCKKSFHWIHLLSNTLEGQAVERVYHKCSSYKRRHKKENGKNRELFRIKNADNIIYPPEGKSFFSDPELFYKVQAEFIDEALRTDQEQAKRLILQKYRKK